MKIEHLTGKRELPDSIDGLLRFSEGPMPGFSPTQRERLRSAVALARRISSELASQKFGPQISSSDMVAAYTRGYLRGRRKERLYGLFLDGRNRVIDTKVLAEGTVNHGHVSAREILRECLMNDATGLILVHNHPGGDPSPSQADVKLTRSLSNVLAQIDVRLVDHVVVAGMSYVSLAASCGRKARK